MRVKLLPPGLSLIKAGDFSITADRKREEGRITSSNMMNFFAESVRTSFKRGAQFLLLFF